MKHEKVNNRQRRRRRFRVRNRVKRDSTRLRLSVFRSHKHMCAQIIDDSQGRTLVAACTADKQVRQEVAYGGNCAAATVLGKLLAQRALEAGIKQVAFDRREYKYHGRVAALADAVRDGGVDLGAKKVVAKPAPKAKKKKGGKKPKEGGKKKAEKKS